MYVLVFNMLIQDMTTMKNYAAALKFFTEDRN